MNNIKYLNHNLKLLNSIKYICEICNNIYLYTDDISSNKRLIHITNPQLDMLTCNETIVKLLLE